MAREPFEEVVGTFHATEDSEIRLSVGRGKNGQGFFAVRKFWRPDNSEDMVPTKRGVRLNAENLKDFVAALQRGDEMLEEQNL